MKRGRTGWWFPWRLRWLDPVVGALVVAVAVGLSVLSTYRAAIRCDQGGLIISNVLPYEDRPPVAELQGRRRQAEDAVRQLATALFGNDAQVDWSGPKAHGSVVISGRLAWAVQASVRLQVVGDEDPPVASLVGYRIDSRNWFWDPRHGIRALGRAVDEQWPGVWHGR